MFSPEISFWIMLAVSLGFAGWFGWRHGKHYALGAGMAASLLAGTWFDIIVMGTRINVAMATAIVLLVVYCTHSWREIFRFLGPLDYLIGALTVWHVIVDTYYGEQPLAVAAQAYGQWMLPYAAGRYAFLHWDSLTKLGPIFAIVGVVISLLCLAESWTGTNLWETVFSPRDELVTFNWQLRYGVAYRACGPTRHAIFLSNVLLTLVPFAVLLTQKGIDWFPKLGKWNQGLSPILLMVFVLGVASSISRGPVVTLVLATCLAFAWHCRPAAWSLFVILIVSTTWIASDWHGFIRLLETDEKRYQRSAIVQVDGQEDPVIQSGTRNRLNILYVYGPIFVKGGALGYGSTASSGFPPRNLPDLPTDPMDRRRIEIVDNAFLNIGLAFGWIGLAFFTGLFVVGALTAFQLSRRASTYFFPLDQRYFIAAATLTLAFLFEIATVFWSYDYAFWILFGFGLIAGLSSQLKRPDFVE